MQSQNLAARVGRWSAQHSKAAVIGWVLFVVLAVVVGGKVGQNHLDESATGSGESKRGDMTVKAAGFPERADEQVLVQSKASGDPEVTAAVEDVVGRLQRIDGVTDIESPLDPAARANTVSYDGRSVVVNYAIRGSCSGRSAICTRCRPTSPSWWPSSASPSASTTRCSTRAA